MLLMAVSLVGCYEDKGNYDLIDIKPITIKFQEDVNPHNTVLGETIEIDPIITYEDGTLINESDYTYRWTLDLEEKEGWDRKEFKWVTDVLIPANKSLVIEVKDKITGVTYTNSLVCKVLSMYDATGYLILAENEGNSELSYVIIDYDFYDTTPDYVLIEEAVVHKGVYKKVNVEVMGQNPIKLHEHYIKDYSNPVKGQQIVIQESGSLDVVGTSFNKNIALNEAFLDGILPLGVTIKDAMFMDYVNILTDNNGSLYTRVKATNKLFHSNYFLATPISYQDEVLTDCKSIFSTFRNQGFALIHDNNNKRLLAILDGGTISYPNPEIDAGRILDIPALPLKVEDTPEGFVPLNNLNGYNVEYIGFFRDANSYGRNGYTMVLEKSGEYFVQQFTINVSQVGNLLTLVDCSFEKMSGINGTPTRYYKLSNTQKYHDLLIAIGNKLYIYDSFNSKDPLSLYWTFDANIVAINNHEIFDSDIGFGLDNGQFLIMNMEKGKNVPEKYKVLYETPAGTFENIVDVKKRIGDID